MASRKLLPKPPSTFDGRSQGSSFQVPRAPAANLAVRGSRHSDEEWNKHRPLIAQLYHTHTLNETIDLLKSLAGFECGVRRLRGKVAEWDLSQKKLDESDVKFALAKHSKRKREQGIETTFVVNGVRLEEPRMRNLQKRHPEWMNNRLSPSAQTPESIQYFTPLNSVNTPILLALNRPSPGDDLRRNQVQTSVDSLETSRTFLTIEGTKYPTKLKHKEPRHLHPFHQTAKSFAVGSGRFRKHERLVHCLWAILPIVKRAPLMFSELHHTRPSNIPSIPGSAPYCSIQLSTTNPGLKYDVDETERLLKAEVLIKTLLSLNKQDGARWQGPWITADELQSRTIQQKADSLFGDPSLAYEGSDILKVVVSLQKSEDPKEEILLRVTTCSDPREYVRGCEVCEATVVSIDFKSLDGALTVQFSAFNMEVIGDWKSLDRFRAGNRFDSWESLTSHFDLARSLRGWSNSPIIFNCRCGRKDHFTDHMSHKIDVGKQFSDDVWDIEASAHQEIPYQQFPMDDWSGQACVAARADSDTGDLSCDDDGADVDTDVWDLDGSRNQGESFDLWPIQDEEHSFDSLLARPEHGRAELLEDRVEAILATRHNEARKH